MRVLFYSWEFGPTTGGIGQYMYQMAIAVTALGHEVVIVTGNDGTKPKESITEYGVIYRAYNRESIRSPHVADLVIDVARRHNVDFIEGSDHGGECSNIIRKKNRPPVVIKLHSCLFLERMISQNIIYYWQKAFLKISLLKCRKQIKAEKFTVENADILIAPSKAVFIEYARQGSHLNEKQYVVPNLIATLPKLIENEESPHPTLLFVGRIEALKGIQYLPKIYKEVCKKFPDTVLEIAGGDQYARGIGSMRKWLEDEFGELSSSVRFLGILQPEELQKAYRRSWMLILPTKWDSFGMVVLEAMAHEKPVVTTPNGGMPEILFNTDSPICRPDSSDFSENVIRLIGNKKLRQSIGRACRQRVINCYLPEKIVPQYINILKSNI